MRLIKHIRNALVTAASVGMLLPTALLAADELPQRLPKVAASGTPAAATGANPELPQPRAKAPAIKQQVIDVSLNQQAVLQGNLVDSAGNPASSVNVFLVQDGQVVAAGQSNEKGAFAIANLSGGNYQIAAGDRAIDVRCWANATAPPTAVARTLIQINDVQRGQVHPGTCLLANPWIVAGVAATAIFVPIVIKSVRDNRDDNSTSPLGS